MLSLIVALIVSAAATLWIIHASRRHVAQENEQRGSKPQRLHAHPVPRIGGAGVVAGLLGAVVLEQVQGRAIEVFFLATLLACAAPTFLVGAVQDLSDAISPRGRLLATAVSATIAWFWMNAAIEQTAIPGLDWVVSTTAGSLAVTVFAVVGVANAVNIIDGLNGLAAMCALMMLAALAYVAYQTDDPLIAQIALASIGAVAGFFIWNYPAGLVFLGDGGAYFLGFVISELSILLLARNVEVSPLFPLLLCIYPVFETLFSIYRRWFLRESSPVMPDGIHLHTLIYRRLMRWAVGRNEAKALTRRNSMSSPYLWALCMMSVLPAVAFWDNTPVLGGFIVAFGAAYVMLYQRIVRFKTPGWLRKHGRAAPRREHPDPSVNRESGES